MDVIHMDIQYLKRSKGNSAVAAAAYIAREKIHNKYDGLTRDFSKKSDLAFKQILVPENAKSEFLDRATLWNDVELFEKGSKAQLARLIDADFPVELNREEQMEMLTDYAQRNFVDRGMCSDIAIHDKDDGNPHAHLLLTLRELDENGQ